MSFMRRRGFLFKAAGLDLTSGGTISGALTVTGLITGQAGASISGGSLTMGAGNQILATAGTNSAPGYAFSGATNTGMHNASGNPSITRTGTNSIVNAATVTITPATTVTGALTASSTITATGAATLNGGLRLAGGTEQTGDYTVLDSDSLVVINGASKTATLPATPGTGQRVEIRNLHTTALTIARNGKNIDGAAANVTVPAGRAWVGVYNGSSWYTLSGSYKRRGWLHYSTTVVTAGTTNVYLNPIGYSTTPAGVTSTFHTIPFPSGNLVATQTQLGVAHSTNTFTVAPYMNSVEETTQTQTIAASTLYQRDVHATPLAYSQGAFISCRVDHNGATNVQFATVAFEFEFDQ